MCYELKPVILAAYVFDIFCLVIVITQEKTIQNIEGFDKSKLKHADTAEKVVLPDEKGKFVFIIALRLFHNTLIMDVPQFMAKSGSS